MKDPQAFQNENLTLVLKPGSNSPSWSQKYQYGERLIAETVCIWAWWKAEKSVYETRFEMRFVWYIKGSANYLLAPRENLKQAKNLYKPNSSSVHLLHPPGTQQGPQTRNSAVNLALNTNNPLGCFQGALGKHCADDKLPVVCRAIICLENASSTFPFKNKYNPYLITEWLSITYILSWFYTKYIH